MTAHVRQLDSDQWLRASALFADHSYRQGWSYGIEAASLVGARSEHIAIEHDGKIIGLADIRLKRLPVLGGGLAYINGGPLVRRWDAESDERCSSHLRIAIDTISDHYSTRGWVVRIAPIIGSSSWIAQQKQVFEDAGFRAACRGEPYSTILVDLHHDHEHLRKRLAQKWRNCLNASDRSDLDVQQGTDPALFDRFSALFDEITMRKSFRPKQDDTFYRNVQDRADERERLTVTIVSCAEGDAAGHVGSILGDTAVYLLGASNTLGRKTKAAYLAQWAFMIHAKERGCLHYDLGGIDPLGNKGVYRFKSGMGGVEVSGNRPFEFVGRSIRGRLTMNAERVAGRLHALMSRRGAKTPSDG